MGIFDDILKSFSFKDSKKKSEVKVTVSSHPMAASQVASPNSQMIRPGMPRPGVVGKPPLPGQPNSKIPVVPQSSMRPASLTEVGPKKEEDKSKDSTDANSFTRLNDVEAKLQKLDVIVSKIQKEHEASKSKLAEIDSRLVEMLSMYELISNQMNPFVGDSKSIQITVSELKQESDRLREEFDTLKSSVDTKMTEVTDRLNLLSNDVALVATQKVNVLSVIKGIVSKAQQENERVKIVQHVKNEVEKKPEEVKKNG